jgi:hypothetical protein
MQVCPDSPELSPVAGNMTTAAQLTPRTLNRLPPNNTVAADHQVYTAPVYYDHQAKILDPETCNNQPHRDPDQISPSKSSSNPSPGILEFSPYGFENQPTVHHDTQANDLTAYAAIDLLQYDEESDDENDYEHQGEVNVRDVDAGMREFYGDSQDENLPFRNYGGHHLTNSIYNSDPKLSWPS